MILKTIDKPTDLFIVGSYIVKDDENYGDFIITDGEDYFETMINNVCVQSTCSDGFVNILTREEFNEHKEMLVENLIDQDFIFVPNFVGEIKLQVAFYFDENGPERKVFEDLDLDEYLMHQDGFHELYNHDNHYSTQFEIVLPDNTKILDGLYDEDENKFIVNEEFEV